MYETLKRLVFHTAMQLITVNLVLPKVLKTPIGLFACISFEAILPIKIVPTQLGFGQNLHLKLALHRQSASCVSI